LGRKREEYDLLRQEIEALQVEVGSESSVGRIES